MKISPTAKLNTGNVTPLVIELSNLLQHLRSECDSRGPPRRRLLRRHH